MLSHLGSKTLLLVLCTSLVAVVGCGGKFKLAPVSGTVTLDGKPLSDATVSFTPAAAGADSPASSGKTDSAGKYSLKLVADESNGAVLGKHQVTISKNFVSTSDVATPDERSKAALPEHDFSYEVKSGQNNADFKLESKKGK